MDFLFDAFSFDWKLALVDFLRVAVAFVLAIPIGWERHRSERNLGLRTFPIVAMAACGFMLIVKNMPGANAETHARLIQGLISGIGFIGGGAILKEGASVRGLATASSIWCTGAIGAAVAFERVEIGIVLSLITFLTLRLLTPVVEHDDYGGGENDAKKGGENESEK
ncbi:MAG TPA: MgtC/SapB family protein [Pyrinomonadaceae bacterium]|nr:MgtC/SapB family protein [Pyrinomonadaceae bacterium]